MQRWEYKVVVMHNRQYTAGLNEYGSEGWELVNVVLETLAPAAEPPQKGRRFPLPGTIGLIEQAADKVTKLGEGEAREPASDSGSRLLWVFRRPVSER
jgi:hypothetical protein